MDGIFDYAPYGGAPLWGERTRVLALLDNEVNAAVRASASRQDSKEYARWLRWRAVTDELIPGSRKVETANIFVLLMRQGYTPVQLRAMFALAFT